ncbi:MAG: AI-2E family transporter [Chloroflexota bacterium]|nr:AI-2E family transporter [Chloroflexota bacterium]
MTDHEQRTEANSPVILAAPAQPPLSPLRLMIYTLAVLFVIGLVWFIIQIRSIILLLILGILLAAAIEPLVNRIRRFGLSRGQAILAIYVLIFAILGVTLYVIAPPLIRQGTGLLENAPEYVAQFQDQARASNNDFIRTSGVRAINRVEAILDDLMENPPIEATQAIGVLTSVFGILFTTASVMIVAFYWMTEKAIIKRVTLSLFPIDKRDRAHGMWDQIESKIGGWTRGQLILMVVIGSLSTVAYSPLALDLEFWFLIGIFAGLTELIPFIGPVIGGALAFIVALTDSWQKALLVVLFVVVLQQVEGSVLVPRIMRNAVGLTPLSVILAVLVGGTLMGPLGAVLAIPVAAAVQVLVQDLLRAREESVDTGTTGDAVAEMLTSRPTVRREPHGAGAASYSVAKLPTSASDHANRTPRSVEPGS